MEVSVGSVTLDDVGDMTATKQALTEAVLWPLQHPDTFARLKDHLDEADRVDGTDGNRLYYLATIPSVFGEVAGALKDHACTRPGEGGSFVRIVVEKPFGRDLDSAGWGSSRRAACCSTARRAAARPSWSVRWPAPGGFRYTPSKGLS